MYAEGAIVTAIFAFFLRPSKLLLTSCILLWPIALPFLAYKAYKKLRPIIIQFQENPILRTLIPTLTPTTLPNTEGD